MAERVTTTITVTETAAAGAASAADAGEAQDPKPALAFRGNGDRRLPPFRVPRSGTLLRWTNTGEVFSLFSEEGTLVDSVAGRGETFLQRGVHRIDVVASGTWTIAIMRGRRAR